MDQKHEFDVWLTFMDDRLGELMQQLPKDVASQLDFTPESLFVIENWLMSQFSGPYELMEKDKYLLDKVACYLGEVIRISLGGHWGIDYSDPNDAYCGIPTIRTEGEPPICPLTMVTTSLDRRKGNLMENNLRRKMARRSS